MYAAIVERKKGYLTALQKKDTYISHTYLYNCFSRSIFLFVLFGDCTTLRIFKEDIIEMMIFFFAIFLRVLCVLLYGECYDYVHVGGRHPYTAGFYRIIFFLCWHKDSEAI